MDWLGHVNCIPGLDSYPAILLHLNLKCMHIAVIVYQTAIIIIVCMYYTVCLEIPSWMSVSKGIHVHIRYWVIVQIRLIYYYQCCVIYTLLIECRSRDTTRISVTTEFEVQ